MAAIKGLKAKVDMHPQYKVPRRIYDIEQKPARAAARKVKSAAAGKAGEVGLRGVAEAFLKKVAKDLKISPDLSQLKFDKVNESILGSHVLFQQYEEGKPISGAWVKVDIDKAGKVYNMTSDLVPNPVLKRTAKAAKRQRITRVEAVQLARKATHCPATKLQKVEEPELVFWPVAGVPTLAWKVLIKAVEPAREYKVYVDAETGKVLDIFDLLKYVVGIGKVFNPNPVVSLSDTTLKDISTIPAAAYVEMELKDLDNTGLLEGPFVSTRRTPNRVQAANEKFLFARDKRAFKEVMVYYHIDTVQRYIQTLGFNNVSNRAIEVNIDGTSSDNSFYSPMTKSLTFGTGGVDDAEDADIILHEYGHAIQDNQVPGFGPSGESRAMGEGFGDYLAASFFADLKGAPLKPCVGSWDAVSYSSTNPPCLRRVDSHKKYPDDLEGEEHDDGEIWSACLWELRTAIGAKKSDQLVLAHHFLETPTAAFRDAAEALVTADKNLNQGQNEATIRDIFTRRGILEAAKKAPKTAAKKRRRARATAVAR
jgi:Zn-dependent metalloprotease